MADLDAELLALAGGDSSDEESTRQQAAQPIGPTERDEILSGRNSVKIRAGARRRHDDSEDGA